MLRKSVFTKLRNIRNKAALFYINDEYLLIMSSNPSFNRSIEIMQNHCVGVYNKFISERHINEDMDFMEARL